MAAESSFTPFKEMTFTDHLEELRKLLISLIVLLFIGFILTYSFAEPLSNFLLKPLLSALKGQGQVVFLGVFDKVMVQLQLSFWSSVILTSPLWFWLLWRFIVPGLYPHEIKIIRPFLIVGFVLFALGIFFCYTVLFPFLLATLMDFGGSSVVASINYADYIVLSIQILVLFGLIFQIPNVMVILGFLELVTKQSLRKMRSIVYVGLTVVAGIVTPPDLISQLLLLVPLVLLFEIGIIAVALIVHPYLMKKYAL